MRKFFTKKNIIVIAASVLVLAAVITGVLAYLTDNEAHINKAAESQVIVDIVEDFVPPDPDDIEPGNTIEYKKEVTAKNTGEADSYIRMGVEFSDGRAENESLLSSDGVNWYTVSDYKNHLPTGWVYLDDAALGGGYYYYKNIVKAAVKNGAGATISQAESTPKLFSYVRTTFREDEEAYPYDIYMYAEAVQTISNTGEVKTGTNAAIDTWRSFLDPA